MAYTGSIHNDSYPSFILNADISSKYLAMYHIVATPNTVDVAIDQTKAATFAGISQETNPLKAGDAVALKSNGYSLAQAGGTVAVGAKCTVTTG